MKLFITILACIVFTSTAYSNENPYSAVLFYYKGKVTISADGGLFGKAEKGEPLVAGDVIKTGAASLAIVRFPDKSTMRVDQNSEIEIEKLIERVEQTSLGSTSIILKAGRTVIDVINKSKAPVFNVKTQAVSVGVRGTRFMTGLDPESGHLDLAVNRGEVHIAHNDKEDVEDAIEEGQSIHLENGSEFNQPQKHDWIEKFNFDANDKDVDHDQMKKVMGLKRLEHKEKRKKWLRDALRWKTKKKKWSDLKSKHLKKANLLKGKRLDFLKKKKSFLQKRKKLVFKRESLLKERGSILKEIKSLKDQKRALAKGARALKTGRKDPRKRMELVRKKKALDLKEKSIRARVSNLKNDKTSLLSERDGLVKSFKNSNVGKVVDNQKKRLAELKKKKLEELKKKKLEELKNRKLKQAQEREKRRAKKKLLRKGTKKLGLPGGLFGN